MPLIGRHAIPTKMRATMTEHTKTLEAIAFGWSLDIGS